jgi:integrase
LETDSISAARERVAIALPLVYALKRLNRRMKDLTQEEFKRAVTTAVTALVENLERTRAPWERIAPGSHTDDMLISTGLGSVLGPRSGFGFDSAGRLIPSDDTVANAHAAINLKRQRIAAGDYSGGVVEARKVLTGIGIQAHEELPLFRQLSLEMLKLEVVRETIKQARATGDYKTEDEFIDYYRKVGYVLPTEANSGPTISEAWLGYKREKTTGTPRPEWSPKTAQFQQATFDEFAEILSELRLSQVDRAAILRYVDTIGKLPKNRRKRYGDRTVADLLKQEFPEAERADSRTLAEKLIRVRAFLTWCRLTKGLPDKDPTERISIKTASESYAPFTHDDLVALFNSNEYCRNQHTASWQFWIPLVALYTGARQTEIAQLAVRDVVQEDGVWLFAITDTGEDQRVKTTAGIRKVPISSKLVGLGILDYVSFIETRGDARLFPDLPKGKNGWGTRVSRWFNETYKKHCGIKPDPTGRRKVFHSFRHTAITKALSKAQGFLVHAQQVFGHEKSLLGETGTYTAPFPVDMLVPVVEALDYGLDHSAYRDSWRKYVKG